MDLRKVCAEHVVLRFSEDELSWIAMVLSEVCHGLYTYDLIASLKDKDSGEALRVMDALSSIWDQVFDASYPETDDD